MQKSRALVLTLVVIAFAAGYGVRGMMDPAAWSPERDGGPAAAKAGGSRKDGDGTSGDEASVFPGRSAERAEPRFVFSARQLEAVLNMGMSDPAGVFQEMGLTAEQIEQLQSERLAGLIREGLRQVQDRHVRVAEDREGPYLEIPPFPGERLEWIAAVEGEVREIVDDERTPVLARALVARAGLLESGLYRQEIRVLRDAKGGLQMREQSYKGDEGPHREDVYRISPDDRARWGGFLEIPEE